MRLHLVCEKLLLCAKRNENKCTHLQTKFNDSLKNIAVGQIFVDVKELPRFENLSRENAEVTPGGGWSPAWCEARDTVAVIIPYRDRAKHLPVLLKHLHPLLHRQLIHYRVFVVEQVSSIAFIPHYCTTMGGERGRGVMFLNVCVCSEMGWYPCLCSLSLFPSPFRRLPHSLITRPLGGGGGLPRSCLGRVPCSSVQSPFPRGVPEQGHRYPQLLQPSARSGVPSPAALRHPSPFRRPGQ